MIGCLPDVFADGLPLPLPYLDLGRCRLIGSKNKILTARSGSGPLVPAPPTLYVIGMEGAWRTCLRLGRSRVALADRCMMTPRDLACLFEGLTSPLLHFDLLDLTGFEDPSSLLRSALDRAISS